MSNSGASKIAPIPQLLTGRCRELGLPVWRFNVSGACTSKPEGFGAADAWLRSQLLCDTLSKAFADYNSNNEQEPIELFEGMWVIFIADLSIQRKNTYIAIMILSENLFESKQFTDICHSANIACEAAIDALTPIARHNASDLKNTSLVLNWMHTDLAKIKTGDVALHDFSGQLAHAYEQISLLYKLSQSMTSFGGPIEFVQMACDLLQETIDYGWVAIRLITNNSMPEFTEALISSGSIPGSKQLFDQLVASRLANGDLDNEGEVLSEDDHELAALTQSQVISKPIVCADRRIGLLLAGNKCGSDHEVTSVDTQLLDAAAVYLGAFINTVAMYGEQRALFLGILKALTSAIDAKDPYTYGHSERVALLGSQLALACGMDKAYAERVRIAGWVHDVGKIGVPESVLGKNGKLTDEEFEAIKLHPQIGFDILKDIAPLEDILPGVLYHHERWDGNGYPHQLRGEDIPRIGRLLTVVDAFDAMSSDRRYRSAMPRNQVLQEIANCSGKQFDPAFAEIFLTIDLSIYDNLVAHHRAQDNKAA